MTTHSPWGPGEATPLQGGQVLAWGGGLLEGIPGSLVLESSTLKGIF